MPCPYDKLIVEVIGTPRPEAKNLTSNENSDIWTSRRLNIRLSAWSYPGLRHFDYNNPDPEAN